MSPTILRTVIGGCLILLASACGGTSHLTDLRATDSQDVGPFDIAVAHANGDRLTAQVCVGRSGSADQVSDRVLHELMNKGYNRIDLDLITGRADGSAERQQVTWTPDQGKQIRAPSRAADNPCLTAGQVPTSGQAERERRPVGTESRR